MEYRYEWSNFTGLPLKFKCIYWNLGVRRDKLKLESFLFGTGALIFICFCDYSLHDEALSSSHRHSISYVLLFLLSGVAGFLSFFFFSVLNGFFFYKKKKGLAFTTLYFLSKEQCSVLEEMCAQ